MQIKAGIWLFSIAIVMANGYHILIALPTPFISHYYLGMELAHQLLADGHKVTVVGPFVQNKTIPNFTEVFLELTVKESVTGELEIGF